ncbi:saccharopine dehydrogenase-like oxidoreductase [Syngnathus acus]|uniref:saccharopine dehydrogenase-like oxidoreductase n=1 Tax=Syngnathus acus TaxID=161584 RepID=UPI001885F81D|nr:saccharopine dehydrogenase-like oxidoreductase [Syngnathus acus]XP_037100943.1 saccharopine dehydrogenase-like oxidoreductase [Syngnathus acus]
MEAVTSSRPYHIVVFGASGFTGKFVVEEVARYAADSTPDNRLKWAVAGRSGERLKGMLEQVANRLAMPELSTDVDIIVADVSSKESLAVMCQQALVILNCVGPYRFYGEPVVAACVENGAHYIDICGEPQFLERMQLEYHSKALDKGVYVIGSCGFDSIPADLGILYTQSHFKGTLTAVESFLTISSGPEGSCGHDATWQSAVHGFADSSSLRRVRRKFGHKPLPVVGTKVRQRGFVFYSKEITQYAIPFMGSDPSVVKRTQRFLYQEECRSPIQYCAYVGIGGFCSVAKLLCGGLLFWVMVKFRLGRKLLTMFPSFFSFGMFSKAGPTIKQIEDTCFNMTFFGEGYSEGTDPSQGPPNAKICTEIMGAEPGYVATVIAMVQAAVTVLKEKYSLPRRGGVYTPGSAFHKTSLIDRLHNHGFKFSVRHYEEATKA